MTSVVQPAVEPQVLAEALIVRYGTVTAVDGLDLQVEAGEVVGVLGGNGAGKSSTLRAIAGVNPPTSGRLLVAGHDLADPAQAERARAELGYCPDTGGLIRSATVREHVAIALASRQRTQEWPHALALLDAFGLSHVLDRETHGFSHGMSRRLSVMLAVLTAQAALILDEPFDGVDPLGVRATEHTIAKAKESGLAVIVSTHLLPLLVGVSDRIVVMASGRAVDSGPASGYAGTTGAQRYEALLAQAARSRP